MAPVTETLQSDKFLADKLSIRIVTTTKDIPVSSEVSSSRFLSSVVGLPVPVKQADEPIENYTARCQTFMNQAGQKFVAVELEFTNSNAGRRQLAELLNHPLINRVNGFDFASRSSINNSFVNTRQISSRVTIRDDIRQSFGLSIYYACHAIAHSELGRRNLSILINNIGIKVPIFFSELLNSVRKGKSGNLLVTPGIQPLSKQFIECANLQKSAFDIEYLTSMEGISEFINILMQLSTLVDENEGLITKFVLLSSVPSWYTTEPITQTAYSVVTNDYHKGVIVEVFYTNQDGVEVSYKDNQSQNTTAFILPHSYTNSNELNAVHLTESIMWSRIIYTQKREMLQIFTSSKTHTADGLRLVITQFVVFRVMGHLLNGPPEGKTSKRKNNYSKPRVIDTSDQNVSVSTERTSQPPVRSVSHRAPETASDQRPQSRGSRGRGNTKPTRPSEPTLSFKNNPFLNYRDVKTILNAVEQLRQALSMLSHITNTKTIKYAIQ